MTDESDKDEDLDDVRVACGPILLHIWEHFLYKDCRSYSDKVSAEEMILRWSHVASLEAQGSPWRIDAELIAECVTHLGNYLCETPSSSIGMERWLHALLCSCAGLRARKAGMRLQALLRLNLAHSNGLQAELEAATGGRHSHRKIRDLLEVCCRCVLQNSSVVQVILPFSLDGKTLAEHCLDAFGFTGDELATYPQILGLCFGRIQVPVAMHLYDLSKGMAQSFANVEGIWHTGVVVFETEYFYNGRVVHDTPNASDFGKASKAVDLGWTLYKQEEFHAYVCDNLTPAFTLASYDTFSNNCNHFTDKVLRFLLDKPLPKEILQQQDKLLEIPGMQMLWPAFRTMIRGLYGDGGKRGKTVASSSASSQTTGRSRNFAILSASGNVTKLSAEDCELIRFSEIDGTAPVAEQSPASSNKWSEQRVLVPVAVADGGYAPAVESSEIWSEESLAEI